ncbi:MAG: GTP-binding protein [Candidatus Thorarchaeota archaeon]|jgi:small GTP-binding protein
MAASRRWQFKICLIGDGYVGKTSIRRKYLGQGFRSNYIPSLGVDFAQKTVMYKDDESVRLVIWDIAGQPQFQSLRKRYYEGCSGLILAYSVVDRESFDNASKWLVEAKGFIDKFPALIIVGNKIDLRSYHPKENITSYEEGLEFTKKFSEQLNTPAIFIETSALTGENIDRAFEKLTRMMINPEEYQTITTMHEVTLGSVEQSQSSEPTPIVSQAPSSETVTETPSVDATAIPQEDDVALTMTELIDLRAKLKKAEEEFRDYSLEVETRLLNLRNTVHVKKIMYEHLRQQLTQTRQEWSDAYDEHSELDQQKKQEVEARLDHIEGIRTQIDKIETSVRKKVRDLELEKRTD